MHNDGEIDPLRDIETINGELALKDLQAIEKIIPEIEQKMKGAKDKRKQLEELEVINRCKEMLEKQEMVRDAAWKPNEIEILNKHLFLTSKPMIYLVNIGDIQYVKK